MARPARAAAVEFLRCNPRGTLTAMAAHFGAPLSTTHLWTKDWGGIDVLREEAAKGEGKVEPGLIDGGIGEADEIKLPEAEEGETAVNSDPPHKNVGAFSLGDGSVSGLVAKGAASVSEDCAFMLSGVKNGYEIAAVLGALAALSLDDTRYKVEIVVRLVALS